MVKDYNNLCVGGRKKRPPIFIKMEKLELKKKKYSTQTSVVSLRMPVDLIEKIEAVAEKTGRARNDVIIRLIDFGLDNLVIKEYEDKK